MNWDAVGAVGEVIGALAVFGTLVYLALQIRIQNQQLKLQNTEARLGANQQYFQSIADIQVAIAHDSEFVQIYVDLMTASDWESFDVASITRLYLIWAASFKIWEGAYYRYQENQLDAGIWQSIERANEEILAMPAFAEWWSRRYVQYSDDFAQYISNIKTSSYQRTSAVKTI